jgi:UDP-N-acetylmuramoylalanine--D-glutamate ligase
MRPETVLVLGLARSGVAAAKVAASEGSTVLVVDDKPVAPEGLPADAERVDSATALVRVPSVDLIIPSPGVPASHPILAAARAAGFGENGAQ